MTRVCGLEKILLTNKRIFYFSESPCYTDVNKNYFQKKKLEN